MNTSSTCQRVNPQIDGFWCQKLNLSLKLSPAFRLTSRVCCWESAMLAVTAYVPGETLTCTSTSSSSSDDDRCFCRHKAQFQAYTLCIDVKTQELTKVDWSAPGGKQEHNWAVLILVWSRCWCDVPRTCRLVQVPPLSVAGLRATARMIEPLQHTTCSHLQQELKQVFNPHWPHAGRPPAPSSLQRRRALCAFAAKRVSKSVHVSS